MESNFKKDLEIARRKDIKKLNGAQQDYKKLMINVYTEEKLIY